MGLASRESELGSLKRPILGPQLFTPFRRRNETSAPTLKAAEAHKGGSTVVTFPRTVTQYRDSVDRSRAHVTYQKLVTR